MYKRFCQYFSIYIRFTYICVSLSAYSRLLIYLSTSLPVHMFTYLSVNVFICLPIHLYNYPPVYLPTYLLVDQLISTYISFFNINFTSNCLSDSHFLFHYYKTLLKLKLNHFKLSMKIELLKFQQKLKLFEFWRKIQQFFT